MYFDHPDFDGRTEGREMWMVVLFLFNLRLKQRYGREGLWIVDGDVCTLVSTSGWKWKRGRKGYEDYSNFSLRIRV